MSKIHSLLNLRLKSKKQDKKKIEALANIVKKGSFSNFPSSKLSEKEKEDISNILKNFQEDKNQNSKKDLEDLILISSEVKSINNQAILLHGERIKKAQTILKSYKEGAFTAWLITTYGNRQTPYNFLQYFEFYSKMPINIKTKIDEMPKQAIYSLASRAGDMEKKESIIKNYKGETKQELLSIIRKEFPLNRDDKRLPNIANQAISSLIRLKDLLNHSLFEPTKEQKNKIYELLDDLFKSIN